MSDLEPAPALDNETQKNLKEADVDLDIQSDINELIAQLERGEDLTSDQVESYNAQMKENFKEQLQKIEVKIEVQLRVNEPDSVQRKLAKLKASKGIMNYLKSVFDWIIHALGWILGKISQGIKWCYQKVKDAFSACLSFLGV